MPFFSGISNPYVRRALGVPFFYGGKGEKHEKESFFYAAEGNACHDVLGEQEIH